MHGHRGQSAHGPFGSADLGERLGAGVRSDMPGPVEVDEGQSPRRLTEIVNAGYRFLSPVAALGQVHGRAQQVEFADEGLVVDFVPARSPCGDPQGLPGVEAGHVEVLRGQSLQVGALDDADDERSLETGMVGSGDFLADVDLRIGGRTASDVRPGIGPGPGDGQGFRQRGDGAEALIVVAEVFDLDAHHEDHLAQEVQGRVGLQVADRPQCFTVVDEPEPALDATVRVENEGFGGHTGRQIVDLLRGDRVQPGQTVGSAQTQHAEVGEVDETVLLLEHALLTQGGPVVDGSLGEIAGPEHRGRAQSA